MPFVWSIGTIVGPAIGGYFCNPSENFPSAFPSHGLFARFPYLLPNFICASFLLLAILAGLVAIEETHPDLQPWSKQEDYEQHAAEAPLLNANNNVGSAMEQAPADITTDSYGTFNSVHVPEEERWRVKADGRSASPRHSKVFTRKVVMLTVALGIFTYHSMTYDHLLPIFLQDERVGKNVNISEQTTSEAFAGGLGQTIQSTGVIMAGNGVIALFIQGVLFPFFASWLGVWKVFLLVTFGHPIAYFVVPYLVLLPPKLLYPGIYVCLAIRNFFSILAYPVLLILLKEACPSPSYLGKINGLAASVGAGCRTIASPVAGFLYGVGVDINFTPLPWWSSALVAVLGAVQVFFMRRQKDRAQIRGLQHIMSKDNIREAASTLRAEREVVRIKIETIPEESEGSSAEGSVDGDEHADEETGLLSGRGRG